MKTLLACLLVFVLALGACAQPTQITRHDRRLINQVLEQQRLAWNKGDLEAYMQGYWKSDSLTFVGSKGLTHGWQNTLDNYRKSYPNPAAMGQLTFTVLKLESAGSEHAYMVGKWHLQREAGVLQGHFSLLWRKINGRWVIISDHSS